MKGSVKSSQHSKKSGKALTDELKKDFPNILKPLFEKYPEVKKIRWTQYTPYFNDGDECTFSAHTDSLAINDDELYEPSDDNEKAQDDFSTALAQVPDEILKDIFGNHVEVIINSDGTTETEEYEHD